MLIIILEKIPRTCQKLDKERAKSVNKCSDSEWKQDCHVKTNKKK